MLEVVFSATRRSTWDRPKPSKIDRYYCRFRSRRTRVRKKRQSADAAIGDTRPTDRNYLRGRRYKRRESIVIIETSSTVRARHEIIAIPIAMNSRPRAKVVLALLGAALLAVMGTALSASPTSASVTRSVSVARASATTTTNYVTLNFRNGNSHSYPCDGGSTFHTDLPNYIVSATNNCHVRVWLHTNNNNTGYSACMSPRHHYTADDTIRYVNVYVSTNTADCQY
jgi:hypothetical protein